MYVDLPEKLRPWCLSNPNSAASRHGGWKGLYGRLDFNKHFSTALTDVNPMGKTGVSTVSTYNTCLSISNYEGTNNSNTCNFLS